MAGLSPQPTPVEQKNRHPELAEGPDLPYICSMKKTLLLLSIAFVSSLALSACGGSKTGDQKSEVYSCPMKCSDQKSDKPGKCEVCGMDLEKMAES